MAFELFLSKKLNKEQVNPRAKNRQNYFEKKHDFWRKTQIFKENEWHRDYFMQLLNLKQSNVLPLITWNIFYRRYPLAWCKK